MKALISTKPNSTLLHDLLFIGGGTLLLFAASQVEIPLRPVPITLQTVAVMLIGLTYTPRLASQTLLFWLGLAAMGFPVLSGLAGGLPYMVGPTGGYLAGFVVAATLMAWLKQRYALNSWIADAALCFAGTTVLFTMGVAWLATLIGFENALVHGVLPFILPGIVKALLLCTGLQIVRHYKR